MAKNKRKTRGTRKVSNISESSSKTFKRKKQYKNKAGNIANSINNFRGKSSHNLPTNLRKLNENKSMGSYKQIKSSRASKKNQINNLPLRERMLEKLKAAKFRFLNEQLYKADGKEMNQLFKNNTESYADYHEGFQLQVAQWPINPVDVIIKLLIKKTKSNNIIIADFGCGEAKIAESLQDHATVHSFDLVAINDRVTQCDMSHTTLKPSTVDIVVFCLSLMGANLSGYIREANRVLKDGGLLKIAEVESRFNDVNEFIKTLERYGFQSMTVDLSHQLFYFFSFKKVSSISKKRKNKLPELNLKPCLYKKR